ncbi:hypothetical protein MTO96_019869 [Rhipicephalus appendiculatus]
MPLVLRRAVNAGAQRDDALAAADGSSDECTTSPAMSTEATPHAHWLVPPGCTPAEHYTQPSSSQRLPSRPTLAFTRPAPKAKGTAHLLRRRAGGLKDCLKTEGALSERWPDEVKAMRLFLRCVCPCVFD